MTPSPEHIASDVLPEDVGEMVERLRAKDADWQRQCDAWEADARKSGVASDELLAAFGPDGVIRKRIEAEAASLIERIARERDEARRSLTAVADFVEEHWRGAGLSLTHEWIIRNLADFSNERTRAFDDLESRLASIREALEPFAQFAERNERWIKSAADGDEISHAFLDEFPLVGWFREALKACSPNEPGTGK